MGCECCQRPYVLLRKEEGDHIIRVLVLSDTHIPRVAHDLPKAIYDAIPGVDAVIHAGDFVEKDLLDRLSKLKKTYAVYGNMDPQEIRSELKDKEIVKIGKFKIGLIHGFGAPHDLANTVSSQFRDVDAIVFGHSHAPANFIKDGVLMFNPGSPTDKIFASKNSYGILEISDEIKARIVDI